MKTRKTSSVLSKSGLGLFGKSALVASMALGVISAAPANAIRLDFDKKNLEGPTENYKEGYIIQGNEWAEWGIKISGDAKRNGEGLDDEVLTLYNTDPDKEAREVGNGTFLKEAHLDDDLRTGAEWGTDPQGNILIVQATDKGKKEKVVDDQGKNKGKKGVDRKKKTADGRYKYVDDDAKGAKITFDFLEANDTYIYEDLKIGLVDIDNSEKSWVTVYYLDEQGEEQSEKLTLTMDSEKILYADAGVTQKSDNKGDNSLWEFNFNFLSQELDTLKTITKVEVDYIASGGVAYLDYDRITVEDYKDYISKPKVRVPEPGSIAALAFIGGGMFLTRRRQSH